MRSIIVACIMGVMLFLTGCGAESGEIYDKHYYEAHSKTVSKPTYIMMCRYDSYLKQNVCENKMVGWHDEEQFVPECYKIRFANADGDKGDECVDKATYDNLKVGDWFGPDE